MSDSDRINEHAEIQLKIFILRPKNQKLKEEKSDSRKSDSFFSWFSLFMLALSLPAGLHMSYGRCEENILIFFVNFLKYSGLILNVLKLLNWQKSCGLHPAFRRLAERAVLTQRCSAAASVHPEEQMWAGVKEVWNRLHAQPSPEHRTSASWAHLASCLLAQPRSLLFLQRFSSSPPCLIRCSLHASSAPPSEAPSIGAAASRTPPPLINPLEAR